LNLDDDVLASAKAEAVRQQKPLGEVVSSLLRTSLESPPQKTSVSRNGIPLFPVRKDARAVTPQMVKQLLDETE
jgi:hypothetical protein